MAGDKDDLSFIIGHLSLVICHWGARIIWTAGNDK
jgi:hypothetical protein